ncbi:FitA-like ribbon-helix-helix domain-containing protein [Demequina mangrovi]|uniref:Arc-like DNA binding domain-containing protein n=1 Tax=Demequina mangrovi TaxID=1043493 RepID=A0A1H6ZGJ1_9MICO|nr:Arc family DNA-binding protein [Demequina mangrovi]SEJ51806.1 Arc-like DNA binding domain-containing protein [Demequina mangrovi]
MSSIIVRGLDESVKKQLAAQAKQHGRSMEAEVRAILTRAAQRPHIGLALMEAAREAEVGVELPIPARTDTARAAAFE